MDRRAGFIAAGFLSCAGAAWAQHPGMFITQPHVGDVRVVSHGGQAYDAIEGKVYPLGMQVAGNCGSEDTILDAKVRATSWPGSEVTVDTSDLRDGDRALSPRPVLVPYSLTPIEWHANWKQAVLAACNQNLVRQMNQQHLTAKQVLARDWPLASVSLGQVEAVLACRAHRSHGSPSTFDASGVPTYSQQVAGRVDVLCAKQQVDDFAVPTRPKTPTDDLTYGVHVVQAHLTILPKTGGNGPCGVTLSGVIETDAIDANVTFFYRNNRGGTTPWRSVKTDHSKTAFFSDFIEFDKPGVVGGFVARRPGAHGPAGNTFAATPSTKDFDGTYQIVGRNIAFESNIGHFAFDCASPPVGGNNRFAKPPPTVPTQPPAPDGSGDPSPTQQPGAPRAPTTPGSPALPSKPGTPAKPLKSNPRTP